MNSSKLKSKIFAFIAFALLMYAYVIPAVLTHNVVELIEEGKADKISSLTINTWNFYNNGRYKSLNIPKEDAGDLKKLI